MPNMGHTQTLVALGPLKFLWLMAYIIGLDHPRQRTLTSFKLSFVREVSKRWKFKFGTLLDPRKLVKGPEHHDGCGAPAAAKKHNIEHMLNT